MHPSRDSSALFFFGWVQGLGIGSSLPQPFGRLSPSTSLRVPSMPREAVSLSTSLGMVSVSNREVERRESRSY